jgi:tRNA (mo5U34)-methyltransferase
MAQPISQEPQSPAAERRRRDIERLGPWFHNLHLPDGSQTASDHPLGDFPRYKWSVLAPHLPQRLEGWTVLDVGANAGFYTFELAKLGARVTAIDVDEHYLDQARWAAREFGLESSVEFRRMQVYELARTDERFDLVLFLGVFYHLRYPLLGLDIVARRARRLLAFQTLTTEEMEVQPDTGDRALDERAALREPGWPRMAFIEDRFAGDPTNWWVPNHAAVMAMLRSSGLRVRSHLGHEFYICEPLAADAPDRAPYDFTPELLAASGRARA